MKTIIKYATAATLAGALALAMATPSQARAGRNAAVIGGFAAGAVIGAAAANSYYGPGYYDEPGYVYAPGYAYEDSYAYEPAPMYYRHYRDYRGTRQGCVGDLGYGRLDYSAC
jgi:hypothetical protein